MNSRSLEAYGSQHTASDREERTEFEKGKQGSTLHILYFLIIVSQYMCVFIYTYKEEDKIKSRCN